MSSLIVQIRNIDAVEPHTNADRLEMVKVSGWYCVTGKGNFKVGDKCLYIPIDSILPKEVEAKIFGPDSKIKLSKSRVRTIKIRGNISQGLVVKPELLGVEKYNVGDDVASVLGITKFEPPAKGEERGALAPVKKKAVNPYFHKYTDIENIKNFPDVFLEGEDVVITEKLHGTSFRCGWFPTEANTFWKKLKNLLGILPKWEFCYGSRNVQLQDKRYTGFYDENVYHKIVREYALKEKLKMGQAVYGEIVGPGIQAGYHYGCKEGEHKLFVYDVSTQKEAGTYQYLSHEDFVKQCDKIGVPRVPQLAIVPFVYDAVKGLTEGVSTLCDEQKVREGVVIKPLQEQIHPRVGRKVLKFISDAYLMDDKNTDFH